MRADVVDGKASIPFRRAMQITPVAGGTSLQVQPSPHLFLHRLPARWAGCRQRAGAGRRCRSSRGAAPAVVLRCRRCALAGTAAGALAGRGPEALHRQDIVARLSE